MYTALSNIFLKGKVFILIAESAICNFSSVLCKNIHTEQCPYHVVCMVH